MTMKKNKTRTYERPLATVIRMAPISLLDGTLQIKDDETVEQYSKRNDMHDTDWEWNDGLWVDIPENTH